MALSSVMLLGMMVVGAGAASYDDVDAEHNVEAIEVLQAVEVMIGDGDNFNPEAPVTRQEMAVIMCNLLDYTVSSYKGTTSFTDVAAWALPYVEACYTNGIITGYSATEFGGSDTVTTGQAALMLLKALGYFQETGDFGSDWLVATTKQGALIELFDGVDNGAREALTRNDVAQLVLNALKSDCVKVDSHDIVSDGKGGFLTKANYVPRDGKSTAYNAIYNDGKTIQLGEELFGGDLKMDEGEQDAYNRPATTWTLALETIGVYPATPDVVYTTGVSKTTVYNDLGSDVYGAVKDGASLTAYANGDDTAATPLLDDVMNKKNTGTSYGTANGTVSEFYVDSEGNVTLVQINTYLVQAASDYNAVKEEVKFNTIATSPIPALASTTLSSDDFDGLENIKDGDYLLVTLLHNGTNYDVYDVAFAEVVEGTVEGYTQNFAATNGSNVTLDGTKYSYSAMIDTTSKNTDYAVGEAAALVLDQYGYVIGVAEALVSNNFVYVTKAMSESGLSTTDSVAEAFFTDGTSKVINVAKVNGAVVSGDWVDTTAKTSMAGWYRYTVNANGKYILTGIDHTVNAADVLPNHDAAFSVKDGSSVLVKDGTIVPFNTSVVADNDSILIVVDKDGNVETYVGATNMPKITMTSGNPTVYQVINNDSFVKFAFVDLRGCTYTTVNSAADPEFVFVLEQKSSYFGADGDQWWTYKALLEDGSVEEIVINDDSAVAIGDDIAADQFDLIYTTSYDKNGRISGVTAVDNTAPYFNAYTTGVDTQLNYSNGALTVTDGSGDFNANWIVADAKIVLITAKSSGLNTNKDADYVVNEVSASYLNSVLGNGDKFDARIAGKTVDANANVLDTLYVYVTAYTAVP